MQIAVLLILILSKTDVTIEDLLWNSGDGLVCELNLIAMRATCAEFLGTAMLLFLGCFGCLYPSPFVGPLVFGGTLMTVIQIFGHISGGHFNPAVTVGSYICTSLPFLMVVSYVAAQLTGALAGYFLFNQLLGSKTRSTCETVYSESFSFAEVFVIEMICTALLVFICCGLWDGKNIVNKDSAPIKFGFFITTVSMAIGPITGASLNPARSLAPLLIQGNKSVSLYTLYIFAPLAGASIAALIYVILFDCRKCSDDDRESQSSTTDVQ